MRSVSAIEERGRLAAMKTAYAITLAAGILGCLFAPTSAQAHTVSICWTHELDGSTTFYARTYHAPSAPADALVIDGEEFPFTALGQGRPPNITACQPVGCGYLGTPAFYLSVNVPRVRSGAHEIGVTCESDEVCGFPGCYPMAMEPAPGCEDYDADAFCDEEDNCPEHENGDQADTDGDAVGDACDVCPLDAENDADQDGVCGDADVCPETVLPERVPTVSLGRNRFAEIDGDAVFDTTLPGVRRTRPAKRIYTIVDTAGCSCEQIIAAAGLGRGLRKFGCTLDAMDAWIAGVAP
jgi:hypothetical protein